jgi:hypothetical protein
LVLVSGVFLWLNLRPTGLEQAFNLRPPDELDPLTRALFYRGWPLSPCTVCVYRGMRWHPEESFCQVPLLLDALVALGTLAVIGCAWEVYIRRRKQSSPGTIP